VVGARICWELCFDLLDLELDVRGCCASVRNKPECLRQKDFNGRELL
jgi:hypothetical protein